MAREPEPVVVAVGCTGVVAALVPDPPRGTRPGVAFSPVSQPPPGLGARCSRGLGKLRRESDRKRRTRLAECRPLQLPLDQRPVSDRVRVAEPRAERTAHAIDLWLPGGDQVFSLPHAAGEPLRLGALIKPLPKRCRQRVHRHARLPHEHEHEGVTLRRSYWHSLAPTLRVQHSVMVLAA